MGHAIALKTHMKQTIVYVGLDVRVDRVIDARGVVASFRYGIHAKTAMVDGTCATVGTANLDDRSLFMNHEINLISRDLLLCRHAVEVIGRPARRGL